MFCQDEDDKNSKLALILDHDRGLPNVAKFCTPYLKSYLKLLKFRNLKSRNVETVISKFLYISVFNHVKMGRKMSSKFL